ncbi:SPW repeat protein [Mesorhizobium sp. CCNWLW179-1]|uniref:SPW repeat protein n=1 Tax=unclassified Mesorhizobium TaxID=325217 RepID=UPI003014F44D
MAYNLMEGKRAQDWCNLVLAVCLFVSPWVIGFALETEPAWNAWIVGVALAALSLATLSTFAEWEEWANVALGLWLVISPWVLEFTANVNAMWTHVVLGVLVAAVSAWAVWAYHQDPHAHA